MGEAKGKFASFEGIDNCGKGTQIAKTVEYLEGRGVIVQVMREPGGTAYGEAIRAILIEPKDAFKALFTGMKHLEKFRHFEQLADEVSQLDFDQSRTPFCEQFLLMASRSQYSLQVKKLLEAGANIISDRFGDSSAAFQGGGHRIGVKVVDHLNTLATNGIWPHKTFFIDITVDEMYSRLAKDRPDKPADYFEKKYPPDFFERVREAYLELHRNNPGLMIKIDGGLPPEEVFEEIRPHLDGLFGLSS